MGKAVGGLLGAVGLGSVKTPKANAAAAQAVVAPEVESNKKARQALIETQGGIIGEELTTGQVKRRDNIFGN